MHESDLWQKQLAEAVTDPLVLFEKLALDQTYLKGVVSNSFKLRVPLGFVRRMKQGDIHDPLLRQVLPLQEENQSVQGFADDPLQEKHFNPVPGLVHKYKSRVLLMPTRACAIHCRYCFRRHFPYEENGLSYQRKDDIINYIQHHPEINEVIFSGGDPLVSTDKVLEKWLFELEKLPQLHYLRIHSRLPIVLPSRITTELVSLLLSSRMKVTMVVHCNHPQEVDEEVLVALKKMTNHAMTVMNQTALLKGVNDEVEILAQLNKKLFQANVLPYYLHLLDRVAGTHHFEVDETRAKEIWKGLCAALPGYLVPRLAREHPGEVSKLWLVG